MGRKQMKNYACLHLVSKPFFLESFKLKTPAGLLTYPHFGQPSHTYVQWQKLLPKYCIGFTVAGLFRIYT